MTCFLGALDQQRMRDVAAQQRQLKHVAPRVNRSMVMMTVAVVLVMKVVVMSSNTVSSMF